MQSEETRCVYPASLCLRFPLALARIYHHYMWYSWIFSRNSVELSHVLLWAIGQVGMPVDVLPHLQCFRVQHCIFIYTYIYIYTTYIYIYQW